MKFTVDLLDSVPVKKNFIIAPGCDMPYDVPVENCIGVAQAAIETDAVREMVKNFKTVSDADYEVPASLKRVMRSYQKMDTSG